MKKAIALMASLAFILIAPVCACESGTSEPQKAEIFYHIFHDNGVYDDGSPYCLVYGSTQNAGVTEIEIPSEYEGVPVIGIMGRAFEYFKGLQRVTLSEGITYISEYAFMGCEDLIEVKLPSTLTTIGNETFRGCTALTNITLPDGITTIGRNAFLSSGVYDNEEYWQSGVMYIGDYLITSNSECSGDYTVKNGTKTIADRAFDSCAGLSSVTIPESVKNVGDYAFYACAALQRVVVQGALTYLGGQAFASCSKLSEVVLGEGIEEIGGGVFIDTAYAANPEHYDGDILYVGNYAVGLNTMVSQTQVVRDGTTLLCEGLFSLYGLSFNQYAVVLPSSVKTVGMAAFGYGNDSSAPVIKVFYLGTSADWAEVRVIYPELTLLNRTVYFYSETQPEADGNYWRFDEDVPQIW